MLLLIIIFLLILTVLPSFAQDVPVWYEDVFSDKILGMVTTIVAATKFIRSGLGSIKGQWAVVLTFMVSIAVAEFTYYEELGLLLAGATGVLAGGASSGLFKAFKFLGKVNPVKVNLNKLSETLK